MTFSVLLRRLVWFACIVLAVSCAKDPTKPGYQIDMLSDMTQAVPSESFSKNAVFADGKTLQLPPEGAVPRGFKPYPYSVSDNDAERAGRELTNPFEPTSANVERGRFVYENFCLACHGTGGEGDGQLVPRYPNPPSYFDKRLMAMPDGRMFHAVTVGRRDMPPHASQLFPEDRWKVILYVRELQKQAAK